MSEVSQVAIRRGFVDAAALIRRGWTRNTGAKNKNRQMTPITDRDAAFFCAEGALERISVDYHLPLDEMRRRVEDILKETYFSGSDPVNAISYFNDYIAWGGEEVAKVFEEAATRC